MDAIDREIKKRESIDEIINHFNNTWEDFEKAKQGKQVYLFGLGIGVDYYLKRYAECADLAGVIDSDKNIQKLPARLFLPEPIVNAFDKKITISRVEEIEYSNDKNVVLITSLRRFEEIANLLEQLGVHNIFALLPMEAQYRREHNGDGIYLPYEIRPSKRMLFLENIKREPLDANKICIDTHYSYDGHGRAIAKELLQRQNNLEIVWFGRYSLSVPIEDSVHYLVRDENFYIYHYICATAKVLISDGVFANWAGKRQGQTIIEYKHWSSVTLKCFYHTLYKEYYSSEELRHEDELYNSIDYILVGSKFDEETCREGFLFDKEVVYVGSPRSDILFRDDERDNIKERLNIRNDTKILLFAPTFQVRNKTWDETKFEFERKLDFALLKKHLEDKFGGDWLILLRLHPLVAVHSYEVKQLSHIVDVSDYPDSQDLVAISDIVITDYSSIMFEPAYIRKPVFLFATDREKYLREDREFLIPYDTLPFLIAETNEELAHNIENFDYEKYVRDVDAFMDKYGVHEDGHASERAARFILDLMDGKVHKGEARDALDYTVVEGGECQRSVKQH